MTGIRRLNHAVLFVSDLDRSVDFYTRVLGFDVVARETRMNAAFLRAADSANHHDLGLFGLGEGAPPPQRGHVGLYHLAWQLDTLDELAELRRPLMEFGWVHRRILARGDAQYLWRRPGRQRVRADVDAPPCRLGRV